MDDFIKDKMKNDLHVQLSDYKIKKLSYKPPEYILNNIDLCDWERDLIKRKYYKKETFKSIAKSYNISRNTLRPVYAKIYAKIKRQINYEQQF